MIYLKNRVNRAWGAHAEGLIEVKPIPEEEKARVRDRLLPILASTHGLVRHQLVPILQRILHWDFPNKWPSFMDFTIQLLNTNDPSSVLAGIQCLLAICRAYRYKASDSDIRGQFEKIMDASFPRLLVVCQELVNQESDEAGEMLHMALKAYKHATWVRYPNLAASCAQTIAVGLYEIADRVGSLHPPEQHRVVYDLPTDRFQGNSCLGHGRGCV